MALWLFSCSKNDAETSPTSKGLMAKTIEHNGLRREYVLYIPDSYNEATKMPVVFNFHGYGGKASEYLEYADMRMLAESENFILVYPQGALIEGYSHWNAGLTTKENKSDVDDFGFFQNMLEEISLDYTVDADRIYTCGYSNGAFFSYALACYHSNLIAAMGSVSGTMMQETNTNCIPLHPMPMINIHGTSDYVVPYKGGEGLAAIDVVLTYWTRFNNTNKTPVVMSKTDNGTVIDYYSYTGGENNVSVEHYKINNGGHVWFDINYEGANTGQLIWDFVSQYDINGLR